MSTSSSELESSFLVLQDEAQPCPYLHEQTARMPLSWPRGMVMPQQLDLLLEQGYRRSGPLLYRTACPACHACETTRLDVSEFRLRRSQRRVRNRGDRLLRVEQGFPQCDPQRLELFNRHRAERGLDSDSKPLDAEAFRCFLVETCCQTRELTFWLEGALVGVATFDLGETSMSAVYTYFRPDLKHLSLGTYAILKSIAWAKENGLRWYYLGFYVADNPHLNYKSNFLPQQRRSEGAWKRLEARG